MKKEMKSSLDFQTAFVDVYDNMRRYVWDFYTIELLAELEVAVYDAFMDMSNAESAFTKLQKEVKAKVKDDEDLDAALDAMQELFNSSSDSSYYRLYQVQEAVKDEDF